MPGRIFDAEAEQELRVEYEAGASLNELADRHGIGRLTIRKALIRAGATMRRRGNSVREFTGEQIAEMAAMWADGRSQTAIAQHFGSSQVTVSRVLALNGIRVVPRRQVGSRHGSWKGGRHTNQQGYVMVRADRDDALARAMMSTSGYVAEHRLIVARSLGRPLARSETVHHINGDRQDNRIENLQIRHGRHGNGVELCCAACGSRDIVTVTLTAD